jgi:hypothetical protein
MPWFTIRIVRRSEKSSASASLDPHLEIASLIYHKLCAALGMDDSDTAVGGQAGGVSNSKCNGALKCML